jgi:pyrimidine deaminase RibD-like protein
MPLNEVEAEILRFVIAKFMDENASTSRKELVLKFRNTAAINRLISTHYLKQLDNGRNLAPRTIAIEEVGDAETKVRAKFALEQVVLALQQLYAAKPVGAQVYRSEILSEVMGNRGQDVTPHVVDRGLFFIQEFEVLDGYGPEPGTQREKLFDVHWVAISERVMELDLQMVWAVHTEYRRSEVKAIAPISGETAHNTTHLEHQSDDYKFSLLAINEARKSVSEKDGRPRPKVGAVVVKDGRVICKAHRGEFPGNHAEFVALERKLPEEALAGATVYTTLEPCTTRSHPKVPCATRLAQRKVARVVIGMLDPDPRITGKGQRSLRKANITTDLFTAKLMAEVEEMNREFTEACERETRTDDGLGRLSEASKPRMDNLSIYGQLSEGKRWVENVLSALLQERGLELDLPIEWTADEGREVYTLEASVKGLRRLWRLSYEALEDCSSDRNIQRTMRRSLRAYFVPDSEASPAVGAFESMSEEDAFAALARHQEGIILDQPTRDGLEREGFVTTADVTNMESSGHETLIISLTPKGQSLLRRFNDSGG